MEKLIGEITHYYSGIEVAIIKLAAPLKKGAKLHFKGATTDFIQIAESMQYNHQDIDSANVGQELGLKISYKVREGDKVFLAEEGAKIGPVAKPVIPAVVASKKAVVKKPVKKAAKKAVKKVAKKAKKVVKKAAKKTKKAAHSKKAKKIKKAKKSKKGKK